MIDPDIMKLMGSDKARIRDLFTAESGSPLYDIRKKWETKLMGRVHEGAMFGLKNYQFYAASDLAWDSNLITKELVPLQLYAQGKITFAAIKDTLKNLDPATRAQFTQTNDQGELTGIKIPEFHKVVVNLVRSLITRRTAALAVKYTQLTPLYRYESLSTSFVAKLRGDVLSQRVEMISNSYGYRHDMIQSIRDMLLYGRSVEFACSSWDKEHSLRKQERAPSLVSADPSKFEVESYVSREGILYTRPHPTRLFWDNAYPLASMNTDTGCTYLGYWNLIRYGDVVNDPAYFNRERITFSSSFHTLLQGYKGYWELYFSTSPVNFPNGGITADVAGANSRENSLGIYTAEHNDRSLLLTEYREKVIPKEVGLGDYPHPVWLRLVLAGDGTVVFGEFLPSIPATYWGFNENDNRLVNNAWAHDIMPWTDMMSNALTNLLLTQRSALIKLILLDIDQVNDPDVLKSIRDIVKGEAIFNRPQLIEYKGAQAEQMGLKPREAIQVSETNPVNDITMHYRSLMQLLSLAERVLGVSSNESAQSEARQISATESANIADTVNTTLAFMGIGVDEAVDAKKKQLYESTVSCAESRIQVPVAERYTNQTIEAAGFEVIPEDKDGSQTSMFHDKSSQTIMGTTQQLVYNYNFSSRDGSERSSNTKSAEVLVNLLAQLLQIPGFSDTVGKERLFMFLNEVVRLSGAGVDLRFDLKDGENPTMPSGDEAGDNKDEIQKAIQQIIQAIEDDRQKIAQLQQMAQQITGAMPAGAGAPPSAGLPSMPPAGGPPGMPPGPPGMPPGPNGPPGDIPDQPPVFANTLSGQPTDRMLHHPPGIR